MKCKIKTGSPKLMLAIACAFLFGMQITLSAQNQRVTLKASGIPINEVFKNIKNQTNLSVIYNVDDINPDKLVNVNANNQPVGEVLDNMLKGLGQGLTYIVKDNYIVVTKKRMEQAPAASPQKRTITGIVVDENNEPLIGVNVIAEGTATGTATDIYGNFSLSVDKDAKLMFSYIGFASQTVNTTGVNNLRVVLTEDGELLDEVVVTALGIKRSEKALSYNVQKVEQSALTTIKDANFVNSLNGKVAGVNITRSSSGIGGATRVVMRGSKSIVGNNNVLYVVDGMPIGNSSRGVSDTEYGTPVGGEGISDFNSEDIESISVLTGPSAAALYGAAAANGVILINTKRGQDGKLKINFSSNNEFLNPLFGPDFQNTYGNRAGEYRSWGEKLTTPSTFNPMDFFNTGFNTINSLNLSTGNRNNQTFLSAASTNSNGIIPNNKYYRYNFSTRNTSLMLDDKLHLDLGASYIIQGDQNMLAHGRYFNPLIPLYLFPRGDDFENVKIYERYDSERRFPVQYWPYGDQGYDMENPYWIVNREIFSSDKKRYMLHARAQYDLLDWLNIAGRVRLDNTYSTNQRKLTRIIHQKSA